MIRVFGGVHPRVERAAFVADSADVIGDVELGPDASVWFGCVIRGDVHRIRIGAETNIQDLTLVHVTGGRHPTHVGARVTVGHRAILHGCTIHDRCLIGMGAIVLDGALVEEGAIVAAGALVTPGTKVPAGMLVMGAPARVVRAVTPAEAEGIDDSAARYAQLARAHAAGQDGAPDGRG